MPRVGVQFEIDASGILHVLARDIKTGRQEMVKMASAVDVDDAAVQRMVEESVEHAFDDLRSRQWVEARLRAVDTLAATRKGLAGCEAAQAGGSLASASSNIPAPTFSASTASILCTLTAPMR